jgi:hypothetical protein
MTLFWDKTGPLVAYSAGVLRIEDLNPEQKMKWSMSRWELFKLGLKCIQSASMNEKPNA